MLKLLCFEEFFVGILSLMKELLQNLLNGVGKYLTGKMSLEEIEDELTSPIIVDESGEYLPDNINDIVYKLDMWEINNWSRDDIMKMKEELQAYLQTL